MAEIALVPDRLLDAGEVEAEVLAQFEVQAPRFVCTKYFSSLQRQCRGCPPLVAEIALVLDQDRGPDQDLQLQ